MRTTNFVYSPFWIIRERRAACRSACTSCGAGGAVLEAMAGVRGRKVGVKGCRSKVGSVTTVRLCPNPG